jgi:hypothetical protein
VAGVGNLICEVNDLCLKGRVKAGTGKGVDALANFVGGVESVEFWVFDFKLFHHA